MTRAGIFYVLSLVIVAGLLLSIVMLVPKSEERFSEVQRDQLLEKDNEWIIQFDIINREGVDTNFTVKVMLNGALYNTQPVLVQNNKSFTYIQHVYRETFKGGEVTFEVYREGQPAPVERTTYYVNFKGG